MQVAPRFLQGGMQYVLLGLIERFSLLFLSQIPQRPPCYLGTIYWSGLCFKHLALYFMSHID